MEPEPYTPPTALGAMRTDMVVSTLVLLVAAVLTLLDHAPRAVLLIACIFSFATGVVSLIVSYTVLRRAKAEGKS